MRQLEEFYCGECKKYFLTYLRPNMNGNYTIECPNPPCGHHHFRKVKSGVVTSDRCNSEPHHDIIMGLRSTLSDKPRLVEQKSMWAPIKPRIVKDTKTAKQSSL